MSTNGTQITDMTVTPSPLPAGTYTPVAVNDVATGLSPLVSYRFDLGADLVTRVDYTTLAASGGSALVGFINSGTGAIARTQQDKSREECSLFDIIPENLQAAIIAGSSVVDVTAYINQALQNYQNVIVRKGIYCFSTPILFAFSEQRLEFEEGAWFKNLSTSSNGIACPHGKLGCKLINPGLIGITTTETGAAAVLWNSNAGGTAPFGSLTSDDMGGLVQDGRFKGGTPGTNGWNTFIHSNMAGGFTALRCIGKGLIGAATTNYGYGHVFSGADVSNIDCEFDAYIANQGRHVIYMGDQITNAMIRGLRGRNFRRSAVAMNNSTTDVNQTITLSDIQLDDVCTDADSSGTNGAFEFSYQGGSAGGGAVINMSNITVRGVGANGIYARGYDKIVATGIVIDDWGNNPGGSYSALRLESCDDCSFEGLQSYSAAANNMTGGTNTITHVFIKQCSRFHLKGGRGVNTGSGAQVAAVDLDATSPGTPDCLVDRFEAVKGSGSWSVDAFVNPTQNGSVFNPYKQGATKDDVQTGADKTIDVSEGETYVTVVAALDSIVQLLPAKINQVVTITFPAATTVKATNFYLAGAADFNADANDTITLICSASAGASSVWREVARSVN